MALPARRTGHAIPVAAHFHHVHDFATELSVWAPVLTLLALTVVAGCILWSKVCGY